MYVHNNFISITKFHYERLLLQPHDNIINPCKWEKILSFGFIFLLEINGKPSLVGVWWFNKNI
jgi:hypothetical protein